MTASDTLRRGWTREELLLAVNLYFQIPFGRQHSGAPEVIELSKLINRSPGSVAMKLNNFTSIDPEEQLRGVRGLAGASKLDRSVWDEFQTEWEQRVLESESLKLSLKQDNNPSVDVEVTDSGTDIVTETERTQKVRLAQGFFSARGVGFLSSKMLHFWKSDS